jgi:hypothetical protein
VRPLRFSITCSVYTTATAVEGPEEGPRGVSSLSRSGETVDCRNTVETAACLPLGGMVLV